MKCVTCGNELPPNTYVCGQCTSYTVHMTYICPKCGYNCDTFGFCPGCGWWASPPPSNWPPRSPWRCPGCGRYHAPHIDTCPFCQPRQAIPWPTYPYPYIGDPVPVYITSPSWFTTGAADVPDISKYIYPSDPPVTVTVSCGVAEGQTVC